MRKEFTSERLLCNLQVLRLCLAECTKGSAFSRNPYLHSPIMKKNLVALHEAIEQVIQDILCFTAEIAKEGEHRMLLQRYYQTYAFLFDFNEGITREEYDHRILMRDSLLLAKFNKLFEQSESLIAKRK